MNNNSNKNNNVPNTANKPSTYEKRDGVGCNPPAQSARPGYKPNGNGSGGK